MDSLLYIIARALLGVLQMLPLGAVARLGRWGGLAFYWLDRRHRRVALRNLERCLGKEMDRDALHRVARENFQRIGENFASAVKTSSLPANRIPELLQVTGLENLTANAGASGKTSRVFAIGHFGNFELYARADQFLPGSQFATTYRALRQPSLNRLLLSLRTQSGCLYFERRTEASALKQAMQQDGITLGLLADQHAGKHGLWLPFFGEPCSTSSAPAVFALRYDSPLHPAICYRTAVGRWRIEIGPEIPRAVNGERRTVEAITADMNLAFEAAVRKDPANWFWVHNRWKPRGPKPHAPAA